MIAGNSFQTDRAPTDAAGEDDLIGYRVDAVDGPTGKVDRATSDVNIGYVVVDTGGLIFGKKVMLPAAVIISVDHDQKTLQVNPTKGQIKSSPAFNAQVRDRAGDGYQQVDSYYGPGGLGSQDW